MSVIVTTGEGWLLEKYEGNGKIQPVADSDKGLDVAFAEDRNDTD
ncbi:hypothetical protein MRB53_010511, partial [Persea americana]